MNRTTSCIAVVLVVLLLGLAFLLPRDDQQITVGAIQQFGKTADGANIQTFSGDRIYLSRATAPSSGTITQCFARVRLTATGSTPQKFVIYSDSGGEPNTFLAQSDEVTVNWTTTALTTYEMSGANEISISATNYWLGVWSDDPGTPSYEYKRDNNASVNRFRAFVYANPGTPESPLTTDGSSNGPMNFYCEYDDAAGGGVIRFGDLIFFE